MAEARQGLMRYLRRCNVEASAADDLVQETFERAIKASGEGQIITTKAFLYKTARNLMLNQRRHQAIEHKAQSALIGLTETFDGITPDRQVAADQEFKLALEAINSLPPKCREVFYLRRVEGLSHSEIAVKLGISTSTIETHLAKGIRLCHSFMKAREAESLSLAPSDVRRCDDEAC